MKIHTVGFTKEQNGVIKKVFGMAEYCFDCFEVEADLLIVKAEVCDEKIIPAKAMLSSKGFVLFYTDENIKDLKKLWSGKHSFAQRIQLRMGLRTNPDTTGGLWQGRSYSHILLHRKDNFIAGEELKDFNLAGHKCDPFVEYHKGATHLNSSQIVCINYFSGFFEEESGRKYLIKILEEFGIDFKGSSIEAALFEYVPNKAENTNFDFYLELSDGRHISFEIKYTEPEFGGANSDTTDYDAKWDRIYRDMVKKCPYLNCEKEEFYENYQVNRNISYLNDGDYAIFLTPRANDAAKLSEGREYIDIVINKPNILNLYWEDVIEKSLDAVKEDEKLFRYFTVFKDKYIDVLTNTEIG